ncbi:MAG: hypothetical protein ACK5LP_05840 [Campylobacteraceae bacterium]
MVKKIILIFALCFVANADLLEDKIKNFIGETKYNESKNLISYLFSSTQKYYKNDDINSIAVLETLKDGGLIELFSKDPQDIELIFTTKYHPVIFMRVISESLNSMGYTYVLTKKISKSTEGFMWHVVVASKNIPSPILLNTFLNSKGCEIENVEKDGNIWRYSINSEFAKIDSLDIKVGENEQLKKPLVAYMVSAKDASSITIRSHNADFWYPRVTFLDGNLKLIEKVDMDERRYAVKLSIPKNSVYIKIEDKYTLENIKRGLNVLLN